MRKQRLILTVGAWLFLAFALTLPWLMRWSSGHWLPTLAAIPVEDIAAIDVSGTEVPIGDLRFVLPEGIQPELEDSQKLPIWRIQMGGRTLKILTPRFWKTWDSTVGICCDDPKTTPYVEQLRQVYNVSSSPEWMWMKGAEFTRYSQRIRCAWGYRSSSATRLMIMPRMGYRICVIEYDGRMAEIKVVEDGTQRIWGFSLFNPDKSSSQEDLIDFASRIRIPHD